MFHANNILVHNLRSANGGTGIREDPFGIPKASCAHEGCWPQPSALGAQSIPESSTSLPVPSEKPEALAPAGRMDVWLWDSIPMWTMKNRRVEALKDWPEKSLSGWLGGYLGMVFVASEDDQVVDRSPLPSQ